MRKLVLFLGVLLVAVSAFAGGGKSCKSGEAKAVQLTGTIRCADGASGDDCARVFRVARSDQQYTICEKSKAELGALTGANVRVTGKVVACDEGEELFIEKAARI